MPTVLGNSCSLGLPYHRFIAIVFYLPFTSFEKNEIENFGILIFDDLFIRDLRIIPEGKICPNSENNLDFMNIWQ